MIVRCFARLGAVIGIVAVLSAVLAPVALAQGRGGVDRPGVATTRGPERSFFHHDAPGLRPGVGEGRDFFRGDHDRDRVRRRFDVPPAVIPFPVAPPFVQPVPVPVPEAVPVPIPTLQAAVLPPLEALMPAANFAQNPPEFLPLQNGTYAVISPALFCGTDQAGTCEAIAAQLAQMTPGWGTALLNGPDGYGVYLTQQGSS